MKVLFAAAEAVPFAKTGGLGDVIGSLPKALKNRNTDIRVIMPLYSNIPLRYGQDLTDLGTITVPVSWRKQYCGLKTLINDGIRYYFIDNEYYFKRDKLYGYDDDAERFAFFSRAILESLPVLGFKPDILHCHDWHTAIASIFLRAFYTEKKFYQGIQTILTIHNIAYQGIFSNYILGDVLGIGDNDGIAGALKYNDGINYLQGGIAVSDEVTTVSRTYAKEIVTPEYGEKLDGLLKEKKNKLHGIINGIDYQSYNPKKDPAVPIKYQYSLEKKCQNKNRLQKEVDLPVRDDICLLAVVSRLTKQKGIDLLIAVLPKLFKMKVQLVIIGTGEEIYEHKLLQKAAQSPGNMAVRLEFDDSLARRVYAGSDVFLMPSRTEPCGLSQLIALRYGSIPIVHSTGGLKDTIYPFEKNNNRGNGFCFDEYTTEAFLETIKEALCTYKKPELWRNIVRNAVKADYSWRFSAKEYIKLYRNTIK